FLWPTWRSAKKGSAMSDRIFKCCFVGCSEEISFEVWCHSQWRMFYIVQCSKDRRVYITGGGWWFHYYDGGTSLHFGVLCPGHAARYCYSTHALEREDPEAFEIKRMK